MCVCLCVWCVLTDKWGIHLSNKVTPCLLLSPRDCILYMTSGRKMWSEIFTRARLFWTRLCVCVCGRVCTSRVWGWFKVPSRCVRTAFPNTLIMQKMLSSSASLFDVSNRHQARGGFILPLSLSFAVAAADCTNCAVVLFLCKKVWFAETKVFIDPLEKKN